MTKQIAIIGGGYGGLSAAYDLARSGFLVTIFESEPSLGGLAGSFELSSGVWLEKFYHHWFSSDRAIMDWLREIGAGDLIEEKASQTGLYYAHSIFRLSSPFDLLSFSPLPLIDRIRTGLMVLAARRVRDWRTLEQESAEEWICRLAGRRSFEVIWHPLLEGKFGAVWRDVAAVWFWNKMKLRGGSRGKGAKETLFYLQGGFRAALERIEATLRAHGVAIHCGESVAQIERKEGGGIEVVTARGVRRFDAALVTTPLPVFLSMVPSLPEEYRSRCAQIPFLGNVCLVLRLRRSLSSTYWLNVADVAFPFVGVIEHTNFDSPEKYGGEHIAYLSKYLPTTDPLYSMGDQELVEYTMPHLQRLFPEFSADWIIGSSVWRAQYSQPVVVKNYSSLIPASRSPIEGIWLSTMAQIYPEDRGTNYAVQYGRRVAAEMASYLSATS
jgi:protoporphyrinogen oxidase